MEGTVVVLSKEECIEGTEVPFLKGLCSVEGTVGVLLKE